MSCFFPFFVFSFLAVLKANSIFIHTSFSLSFVRTCSRMNSKTQSGGFSSIWPPASAEVDASQTPIVFMFFAIAKGLSAITGPLVAAALHPKKLGSAESGGGGGVRYSGRGGWGGFGFTGECRSLIQEGKGRGAPLIH